jgi:hypothetical protein
MVSVEIRYENGMVVVKWGWFQLYGGGWTWWAGGPDGGTTLGGENAWASGRGGLSCSSVGLVGKQETQNPSKDGQGLTTVRMA